MKRSRKILIVIGVLLLVTILTAVFRHQLSKAVADYEAELKADGEPMELAQALPPTIPPGQDGTEILIKAADLIKADSSLLATNTFSGMTMVAPGKRMVSHQQEIIRDFDFTNSWEEVDTAIAQNEEAFKLLGQFLQKPYLHFESHLERGVADIVFTNLYLPESKRAAQRLAAAAVCDLHRGEAATASLRVQSMLAIAHAMRDERLVISELVRIAMTAITFNVTWEILQSAGVTDEVLDRLQRAWMILGFIQAYREAMVMERISGKISLEKWRSSSDAFRKYLGMLETAQELFDVHEKNENIFLRVIQSSQIFLWGNWWSYSDELRCLKGFAVLEETARYVETNGSFQIAHKIQQDKFGTLGFTNFSDFLLAPLFNDINFHSMLSESIPSLGTAFRRSVGAETARRVMVTAIALKRYQLKHGQYPPALSALVPDFLSGVLIDPQNGEPLHYRLGADGAFTLYSVGANGVDDGGDPALTAGAESSSFQWQSVDALDWVWPQPATAEEIESYFSRPSK